MTETDQGRMTFVMRTKDYEIYRFPDEEHCRSAPGEPFYWL